MKTRDLVETFAQRWLADRGVWRPGAPLDENMQRCAQARQRWQHLGAIPGKDWAHAIVADHREGVAMPPYVVRVAYEALGLEPEAQVLRKPRWPVPRPDARERQAGDVEVEF